MTGLAGDGPMRSGERKSVHMASHGVDLDSPALNGMTAVARRSELPPVYIGMTGRAGFACLLEHRVHVTRHAGDFFVLPVQRVVSLPVVIELRNGANRPPRL